MKGFFSSPLQKEEKKRKPRTPSEKKEGRQNSTDPCEACGLYKGGIASPKMAPFGEGRKNILVIGEFPSPLDDRRGRPGQGKEGQILADAFEQCGLDLFQDAVLYNAVNCRPLSKTGAGRDPTDREVKHCRTHVLALIKQLSPALILLVGDLAVQSVIGHRWKKDLGGAFRWRGWTIPDEELRAWVCPILPLSYISGLEDTDDTPRFWKKDLRKALALAEQPLPDPIDQKVEIVDDLEMVLPTLLQRPVLAWDIETTGLKPYSKGHQIATIAFSDGEQAWAAPATNVAAIRRILLDRRIRKIAQNMKFEHTWAKILLNIETRNWWWDTMLASHILDNRPSVTSLKFQTYVRFGVSGYDDEVQPYLKGVDETNANSMNRVLELMADPSLRTKLLRYNALDALFTFHLATAQRQEMGID